MTFPAVLASIEALARSIAEVAIEVRTLRREVRHVAIFQEIVARGQVGPEDDDRDPKVRFDPKQWRGKSCKGSLMSACTPEFLLTYARAMSSIAAEERITKREYNGKLSWIYTSLDAARARRWAYRLRTGWVPAVQPQKTTSKPFATENEPKPFAHDDRGDEEDTSFGFGANATAEHEPADEDVLP